MSQTPGIRCATFEAQRDAEGKVRTGVWDYVCIEGHDEKDGQSTDFDVDTLSQFINNFVERGDLIPIDFNHQSNYVTKNGQPAPALGFYGSLALVWDGKIVKAGSARGVSATASIGIDLSRNGLFAFRAEVTELGHQLLPNYKYLSPTFTKEGTRRDGSECGYVLCAVAATNTPWQAGTEITFSQELSSNTGPAPVKPKEEGIGMAKLAKLAKFAGVGDDADDAAIKQGLYAKMEGEAMAASSDEGFDYAGSASKLEDAAREFEDAHFEDDGDEEPAHQKMRKMAAKFRKLAKLSEAPPADAPAAMASEPDAAMADDEEKTKMADEKDKEEGAKFAVLEASHKALQARLAKFEAREETREKAEKAEKERTLSAFADSAVSGGYPKESREDLISFARTNFEGARAAVAHFLPRTGAPSHLFERATSNGLPVGKSGEARNSAGPAKPRRIQSMGMTFVEDDSAFADKVKEFAMSKDPIIMEKLDKHIPEKQRSVTYDRLLAAERVVRAEYPDLADSADGE